MRIAKQRKRPEGQAGLEAPEAGFGRNEPGAVLAFKAPGKMSRLKSTLFGMLLSPASWRRDAFQ